MLVDDSKTPEEIRPLGYIDWDQLQRLYRQDGTDFPRYWSARDVFFDRKVQLAAPPDGSTADQYKLRIYYRTAIDRPPVNDPNIQINAPEVLSTVVQRYVEYRLLTIYSEMNDPRTRAAYREYRDLLQQLRGMENRSRPGGTQIRMQGVVSGATGTWGHRWPGPGVRR